MKSTDAFFLNQLLLPFCDTSRSGVPDDPRASFYHKVESFSNLYAFTNGLGGLYGYNYKPLKLAEIMRFDGVVVRDGVKGGSNGAIHRRYLNGADYDIQIASSLTYRRFLQIKRVIKLCNNESSPKRGQLGYDPAYKYDLLFKVLINNVNALTAKAELDQCGDETTWGHGGFG